jgi:hypothetical protein
MNATPHDRKQRFADCSPLDIPVSDWTPIVDAPHIRNPGACRNSVKGAEETEAGYGCVDWYQYQTGRPGGDRAP